MTMENIDNKIDNYFLKKFESFKVEDSEKDWNILFAKLSKNKFLKFNAHNLNIYFLTGILLISGIATYSSLNNIQLNTQVKHLQHIIQDNSNKNNQQNLKPGMSGNQYKNVREPSTSSSLSFNYTLQTKYINKVQAISKNNSDSIQKINSANLQDDTTLKPKVKKIKKVIIVKPKNVIVKDTVQIYRLHK